MKLETIRKHVPDAVGFSPSTTDHTLMAQALRRVQAVVPAAFMRMLTLTWVWTRITAYGATDGRVMYLNPDGQDAIQKTSDPVGYAAFLLLHEALHAMLNHGIRLTKLPDRKLSNIAADLIINNMIMKMNSEAVCSGRWPSGSVPFPMIDGGLIDPALSADKSVEELYWELSRKRDAEELAQQKAKADEPTKPCNGGKGGKGQPDDDSDGDDDDSDDDDSDDDAPKKSGGKDKKDQDDSDDSADSDDDGDDSDDDDSDGDGDPWDGTVPNWDFDDDDDDDASSGGSSAPNVNKWKGNRDDADKLPDFAGSGDDEGVFTPICDDGETLDQIGERIDRDIERIAIEQQINDRMSAGVSGSIGIDAIMEQKMRKVAGDWHEQVKNWFAARSEMHWNKPIDVPIFKGTGLVAPGRGGKVMGELVIAIDVSYSVPADKVSEMLGEIQIALDTLKPKAIHLIEAPDHVRKTWLLQSGDLVPKELNYGGGTAFGPAFRWAQANVPDCAGMIYMTDGDSYDMKTLTPPDFPVLWLDWSGLPDRYVFGEYVYMND